MKAFKVNRIKMSYPEYTIESEAFQVEPGQTCEVRAPSGYGKTTLLRAFLGLQKAEGEIWVGDQRVDLLPLHLRNFGVVFQDPLLFPHLNARENASFGLKLRGKQSEFSEQIESGFHALGIRHRMDAPVQELSGGEKQRVALLRATLFGPSVLFLDEPFKGLDSESQSLMVTYLERFIASHRTPVILISHVRDIVFHGVQLLGEWQHNGCAAGASENRLFRFVGSKS